MIIMDIFKMRKKLTIILALTIWMGYSQSYPESVEIDPYLWGDINAPTSLPEVNELYIDPVSGMEIQRIAPDNTTNFTNRYSKIPAFNRSGEWIKQNSSNGTAFIEVANLENIIYRGVNGGGYWSNSLDRPNDLYVLFRYSNDLALKSQTFPNPYGSETLLHDFTDTHIDIGFGMNEGLISNDDRWMVINAVKNDGTPELIVMDLDDCRENPNQPSNIWSRMSIEDNGEQIIDWVTISPLGNYVVIGYFGEYNINPFNGNAIVRWDNTPITPTGKMVVNYTESHASLGVDVNGEEVYIGFKDGESGCPADCMGEDDNTFLMMSRLRDGETVYKFRDTGSDGLSRGLYGGYVTTTNLDRLGYAYIIETCCSRDGAVTKDIIGIRLDYDEVDEMEYYFRSNANRLSGTSSLSAPYTSVSPNGLEFVFNSYWHSDELMSQYQNAPSWYAKYPQMTLNVPEVVEHHPVPDSVEYFTMLGQKLGNKRPVKQGIYIEISRYQNKIESKLIPIR